MPKVSVIIPVYNAEKYLRRCVDSILAQTFTDFELLLINDGSKDNSGAICDEYAEIDKRVKVHHILNCGANNARLFGVLICIGTYVMFIDSDDTISINYICTFYNKINDSGAEIVVKNTYGTDKIIKKEEYISDVLNLSCSFTMIDKIYSSKLLKDSFENLPRFITMGEDIMQSVIVASKAFNVKYFKCDDAQYYINIDNSFSVSHTHNRTFEYETIYYQVFDKYIRILNDIDVEKSYIKSKIRGLSLIIQEGNDISYNDEYFISCKNEYNKFKLKSPEAWIIFNIQNNCIARYMIGLKRLLKKWR